MGHSVPHSLLFWKWSDGDLEPGAVLDQIDDICRRSTFEIVSIGLEHTLSSFDSDRAHEAIAAAAERLNAHGRHLVLSIDPRQEPDWAEHHPDHCLAWVESIHMDLGEDQLRTSQMTMVNDHFGEHRAVRTELLAAFAYDESDPDRTPVRIDDRVDVGDIAPGRIELRLHARPGWRALVFVAHWLDYPDVFSAAVFDRHRALLDRYVDVPLAGAALDEWGTVPHPGFRFERAWSNPWWSSGLVASYEEATGRDLLSDLFRQRVAGRAASEQTAAIIDYFSVLRDRTAAFELAHYEGTKSRFGAGAFVGFHPTWWAVDERHQAAELFKNGFNWWAVRRDVGQTDEVAPMGVRLALARKAGHPHFFNMWYSMGCHDLSTYVQDAWRNARYGGRTTHLGYRCEAERWAVLELAEGGLEEASAMEDRIALMAGHVRSLVASPVLVVVGWAAAVDWRRHVDADGCWRFPEDTLSRGYAALRALWDRGYIAEIVPDYEDLVVDADGRIVWCGHAYDAAVYIDTEPPEGATRAASAADATSAVRFVESLGVPLNDVPWGCRLEDGTVLIAAQGEPLTPIIELDYSNGTPPKSTRTPTALRPTGNPIEAEVRVAGRRVEVRAEDFVVISPDLMTIAAGRLDRVLIDGEDMTARFA